MAYLIITVGSVTHRDLFLENPVTLPVLNVKLSLTGFFAVAPIFFLINHFYLLLHLVGLRRRIAEYDTAIKAENLGDKEDIRRRELDSFVVVQAFGGTSEERVGKTGWFLKAIIWITVIIAPIVVLQQMQINFLAYHHEGITWVHRIATLIDLGFLWLFWPAIHHGYPTLKLFKPIGSYTARLVGTGSGLLVIFSLFVATFPGENIDESGIGGKAAQELLTWQTPKDRVLWPVKKLLPRNLDLRNEFLIDRDLLAKIRQRKPENEKSYEGERTLVLSSRLKPRNLIGANFENADLRSVDLTAASLQGAWLWSANLQDAKLDRAELQGAWLDLAKLQGASLKFAELQGASLVAAKLQGANLFNTKLQGVALDGASLHDADLFNASLQGASLGYASLQGADLFNTKLQGAALDGASLQGASLDNASLQRAAFINTQLWRASIIGQITGAYLSNPILTPIIDHDKLIKNALEGVTDKETQEKIKNRLAMLKPDARTPQQDIEQAKFWTEQEILSLSKTDYQKQLAKLLKQLACGSEHRPYIAQGLTRASLFASSRIEATGSISLARLLLNATPATCSGAVGIDADARQSLQQTITRLEAKD